MHCSHKKITIRFSLKYIFNRFSLILCFPHDELNVAGTCFTCWEECVTCSPGWSGFEPTTLIWQPDHAGLAWCENMKLGISNALYLVCKYCGTVYLWTPGDFSLCQNYRETKVLWNKQSKMCTCSLWEQTVWHFNVWASLERMSRSLMVRWRVCRM